MYFGSGSNTIAVDRLSIQIITLSLLSGDCKKVVSNSNFNKSKSKLAAIFDRIKVSSKEIVGEAKPLSGHNSCNEKIHVQLILFLL